MCRSVQHKKNTHGAWLALQALGRSFQELCFPAVCLICRQPLPAFAALHLCQACRGRIHLVAPPYCQCCGVEFASGDNHLCGPCLRQRPHFGKARAILRYDEACAALVHAFKYGGKTVARATFCALAQETAVLSDLTEPDWIVPVPLHRRRLKERGFNQAVVLARYLFPAAAPKIAVSLLIRPRWTEPQTSLNGQERRRNLTGAFAVVRPERLAGRRILLIDDVFTTGTTLDECAKVLLANGAASVEALTLARVEKW